MLREHTACASFPVLVAHGQDLFHPVIHGFGKPAELLAFLLPVGPQTANGWIQRPMRGDVSSGGFNSHFVDAQVGSFGLYRGEDHDAHRLILLCFSLSRLPVLPGSTGMIVLLLNDSPRSVIVIKR